MFGPLGRSRPGDRGERDDPPVPDVRRGAARFAHLAHRRAREHDRLARPRHERRVAPRAAHAALSLQRRLSDARRCNDRGSSTRRRPQPRDAVAAAALGAGTRAATPQAGFAEQVFSIARARASRVGDGDRDESPPRGWNVTVHRLSAGQLPALFTWRMLGYGTYVMAAEPANCANVRRAHRRGKRGSLADDRARRITRLHVAFLGRGGACGGETQSSPT